MNKWLKPQRANALLGLAFDGPRLEAVVVRRTNGTAEVAQRLSAPLTVDVLTHDPELVGREIRSLLDGAGITERRCVATLPLDWVLSLVTPLPVLPAEDVASFLQIEAERGFPYPPEALVTAQSIARLPGGTECATQLAVPREHVDRLDQALRAARLLPVSFTLGLPALQARRDGAMDAAVALWVDDASIGLLVGAGGGIVALRSLGETIDGEGAQRRPRADLVGRELRVTLGQLPAGVGEQLRRLLVLGDGAGADELAAALAPRAATLGLTIERVTHLVPGETGLALPANTPASPAVAAAARRLAGGAPGLEFLPPRVSAWQQLTARYSSKKLVYAGVTAGAVVAVVALAFLVQQVQLMRLESRWSRLSTPVGELDDLQQQIRRFRPWHDHSLQNLAILRRLTEAFPEDGNVTARSIEIRDAAAVVCSGTARDNPALLKTLDRLRATPGISEVQVDTLRGKSPLQFTFNLHWDGAARQP